jgi:environmental stress-induced protein Ves
MSKVNILPSTNFLPKSWSGGSTTELFIFPLSAEYSKRNFDFRLSTATVEVEKSIFTPLLGISRTLMVLDGEMALSHEGHHNIKLCKMEADKFEGGWKTSSVGRCTDLNLMTTGSTSGTLKGFALQQDQTNNLAVDKTSKWLFIYLSTGQISIQLSGVKHIINKGDLFTTENIESDTIQIDSIESSELVMCTISL